MKLYFALLIILNPQILIAGPFQPVYLMLRHIFCQILVLPRVAYLCELAGSRPARPLPFFLLFYPRALAQNNRLGQDSFC